MRVANSKPYLCEANTTLEGTNVATNKNIEEYFGKYLKHYHHRHLKHLKHIMFGKC